MKEQFFLDEYDFGIDPKESIISINGNRLIDLTIVGAEEQFDLLCEIEDLPFDYGLYPPMLYIRNAVFFDATIDTSAAKDCECGLYFMEHHPIDCRISLEKDHLLVNGTAEMYGKKHTIHSKIILTA